MQSIKTETCICRLWLKNKILRIGFPCVPSGNIGKLFCQTSDFKLTWDRTHALYSRILWKQRRRRRNRCWFWKSEKFNAGKITGKLNHPERSFDLIYSWMRFSKIQGIQLKCWHLHVGLVKKNACILTILNINVKQTQLYFKALWYNYLWRIASWRWWLIPIIQAKLSVCRSVDRVSSALCLRRPT